MKQFVLFSLVAFMISLNAHAQSPRYVEAMEKSMATIFSGKDKQVYQESANAFERIANAEKTEWLPFYYTAYSLVMLSYEEKDLSKIDPILDKAEELISKAEALQPNNSEISAIKAMILFGRMNVDNSRGMTLGPKATAVLQAAMAQQPLNNPRVMMNLAQNLYYTPEAFGGSPAKGIALMERALAAYDTFTPEGPLHPSWGKGYINNTLEQWKGAEK
jgi:hypothetical protein